MTLNRPLFRTQSLRLAQAMAAALDDPRLETDIDTTQFSGAHRTLAWQANRVLLRLREHDGARSQPAQSQPAPAHSGGCLLDVLDALSSNIMIADESGVITHVNRAMAHTLQEFGYELEPAMSGIEASTVIGCSLALFYADPADDAGHRSGWHPPRETTVFVGEREFRLHITDLPAGSSPGARTLVEWREQPACALPSDARAGEALHA